MSAWKPVPRLEMIPGMVRAPGVAHFGRYNRSRAGSALMPHEHGGALEICHLVRGRQTYAVAGRYYTLKGGDVFLAFPGEVHSTGGMPEEKGILFWLAIGPVRKGASLLGLDARQSRMMLRALASLPRRHFEGNARMAAHLDGAAECCLRPGGAIGRARLNHHLLGFLFGVLAAGKAERMKPSRAGAGRLDRVLAHIAARLDEPPSVPELAEVADLSVPRLHAWFKQSMGLPPAEFVLRARIAEACRLLRGTLRPVTAVAFDLGFSSSQYFATTVKRFTGLAPGEIRAGRGSNPDKELLGAFGGRGGGGSGRA